MPAKTCTRCNIEKPLTEFHRRGNGTQNICKPCRCEYEKHPHVKRAPKDNRANFESIASRITELEPQLRRIAKKYATDDHTAEDIFSHVCEKLLRHAAPESKNASFLATARRRAQDWVKREITYTFYVGDEGEIGTSPSGGMDDSGDDGGDTFEFYTGGQTSVEDVIIENEDRDQISGIINNLDECNQQILAMLADGYSQREIANQLTTMSHQAVWYRIRQIQKAFEPLKALHA